MKESQKKRGWGGSKVTCKYGEDYRLDPKVLINRLTLH